MKCFINPFRYHRVMYSNGWCRPAICPSTSEAPGPQGLAPLHGLVILSPHSKGGHLDNLAVAPCARGQGVGRAPVQRLLADSAVEGPAMISLTTFTPAFLSALGFQVVGPHVDAAIAMVQLLQPVPMPPTRSQTP